MKTENSIRFSWGILLSLLTAAVFISAPPLLAAPGDIKWSFPLAESANYPPGIGSDGTIYILTGDSYGYYHPTQIYLYAINPDGTKKWELDLGSGHVWPISIGPDDTIYFPFFHRNWNSYYNVYEISPALYAIRPEGTVKWQYQFPNVFRPFPPAFDKAGNILITGKPSESDHLELWTFSPEGQLLWNLDMRNITAWDNSLALISPPAIGIDGTIYLTGFRPDFQYDYLSEGLLMAINPDGTLQWTSEQTSMPMIGGYSPPAIGPDGTIFASFAEGLHAFRLDGSLKWSLPFGGYPVIDTEGIVYIGTGDNLLAINPDGTIKWQVGVDVYGFDGGINSIAIGLDNTILAPDGTTQGYEKTIYLHNRRNNLVAVDQDGNFKWNNYYPDGDYHRLDFSAGLVIDHQGTLYVPSRNSAVVPHSLHALETSSLGPMESC